MPNWRNIYGPITLVGNGRSGTSLVSQLFMNHPDGTYVGETSNLIHSVYYSMASSLPVGRKKDIPDIIRGNFSTLYPSSEQFWFHKPIGVPLVSNFYKNKEADFYDWYWTVFDLIFPQATYFTVLRHPLDVIASSREWWGRSYGGIMKSHQLMAELIAHPRSKVKYAVNFDDLIKNPEAKSKELFNYLNIPFHPNCLKAFERGHVMTKDHKHNEAVMKKKKEKAFKRIEQWNKIPPVLLTDEFKGSINKCFTKFNLEKPNWEIPKKAK